MKKQYVALMSFFFSQFIFAAGLSVTEATIRDAVRADTKAQLELLEELVNVNSGTMNIAGVKQVGEIVKRRFEALGFKTYWADTPSSLQRAPTLIAEHKGHHGKKLLLIGHLDTVYAPDNPFNRFTLKQHTAVGPGVVDDKGGVVVILYALSALKAAHVLDNADITVVLTGDEEYSGKPVSISRKPLLDAARGRDVALDFESSVSLDTASIARRGVKLWSIEVKGNEAHSATIFTPDVGVGAIFEMSRILNTLRQELQHETYLSFNPGIVLGGTRVHYDKSTTQGEAFGRQNVVAKLARCEGDFRFINSTQQTRTEVKMKAIVKKHLPGTAASITFTDGIPAMPPTENNRKLLEVYNQTSRDLNGVTIKALPVGLRGGGDISHIAHLVPANLVGLGPHGTNEHSVGELVELSSLPIQTERAAILMYRLTK